jgi:hypothetical protein
MTASTTAPIEHTIALLSRTPAALDALLRDLPDVWLHNNEGDSTWTVSEVVGHLIHGERTDWMPRVRHLLEFGETRPFEPFDREGHFTTAAGLSLGQLLDQFAELRAAGLTELRALRLTNEDFARSGRHPAFGPVTLSQLLATWAVHDLTHLHQISRVMAHQYRSAVGPWERYLGVLHCTGSSQ